MKPFLLTLFLVAGPALGKLSVSIQYDVPPEALSAVEAKLTECQNRPYPEYACAERPFEKENKDLVMIGCGPNLPGKDGIGCRLNFFGKGPKENGFFRLGISKAISLPATKGAVLKIKQKLAEAGVGYQHLNLGNPFYSEAQDINYVCERKTEKEVWHCYLDVSERQPL